MTITSKLPDVGTTIFTVMSQLANTYSAVNLSQGFPDFDASPALVQLVNRYMQAGYNQYAPMQGVPALRRRIAEKTRALYGAAYDPDTEITITSGATEALYCAITAMVRPGDEVVIFEPAFDSYAPAVCLNGGIPVYVTLKYPDYGIDWDEVRDALTPRTRLIILNSPHNPTGTILSPADLATLSRLTADHGFFIISDEVYEHIVFDDCRHESLAGHPDLARRSFVISSFGKTYHTTGWKIGYCLAPEPLSEEFRKVHQYITFASNTPIQYAYADIMTDTEPYLALNAFYQEKRDRFLTLMRASRFKPLPCQGTYFQMMDYSSISDETDIEFSKRLIVDHGVAAIPPSVFYHNNEDNRVLRFCFAKKDETLIKATEKLCRV